MIDWVSSYELEPYVEVVEDKIKDTDEFVVVRVFECVDDKYYKLYYVRKTMEEADKIIDGYSITQNEKIKCEKVIWSVAKLKSFLTIDEFTELTTTGIVGIY